MTFSASATSTRQRWQIAAILVLLLACWIEAGHVHNALVDDTQHCVLCQHTVALDKISPPDAQWTLPEFCPLFNAFLTAEFAPAVYRHFALIRAPPVLFPSL